MHQLRRPVRLGPFVTLTLLTIGCTSTVRDDWQLARETDTVAAYRTFLGEHRDSMHATPARQRILELELAADWRRAREEDAIASYEAFLLAHPLSVHAEEAINKLRALYFERGAAAMDLLPPRDVSQARKVPEMPFPKELLETLGDELVTDGSGDPERIFPPRPAFPSDEVSPVPVDYEPPRREGARARAARLLLTIGTPSAEAVVVRAGVAAVAPMLEVLSESAGEQLTMGVRALLEIGAAGVSALGLHLRAVDTETRSATFEILEDLGGTAAAEAVASLLDDWWLGEEATPVLRHLGWQPSSPKERVHLAVARRDRSWLLDHWSTAEEVLLADIRSGDSGRVRLGVNTLIASGRSEVIDDLLEALDPGSALIAQIYLNSGHATLEDAARSWASENGYQIYSTPRGSGVSWGRF